MKLLSAKYESCKSWILRLESKSYFFIYTLLFVFAALITFSWYFFSGRTFIWQGDGWSQHYNALVYYAKYLRSIIQNILLRHQLIIPSYDFNIGEGSDILSTLHYYVIGDPFSVLSVFVPVRFMFLYYEAMILLRLYLSGTAFSFLCFKTGKRSKCAVMAGTMVYIFCHWALLNAVRHPYFLNPMVYLPMLIIGIEKILKKERPYLFIMAVFLSAISNFYFLYVLVLVTIIYVFVRLFTAYNDNIRLILQNIIKIGAASVLGLLLAGVILLPVCYTFLNDTRMSAGHTLHLLYPLSYYGRLPAMVITPDLSYWLCMGFSAPVVPAVFLLFRRRKEYRMLKHLFIICIVIMNIPTLGQIFNGLSYMSNKWCWAFAMLSAYILTTMWPHLMKLNTKDSIFLFCCMAGYFLVCFIFEYSRRTNAFTAIILAFMFLVLLFPIEASEYIINYKTKQFLAFMTVLISIFCNSFWHNAAGGNNYASECKEITNVYEELYTNEAAFIKGIASTEHPNVFYRYSGRNLTPNAGMLSQISSTQYYWSLSNPYINEFRFATEQLENSIFNYTGYDDRTALLTLASVLYYAVPDRDSSPVPYGFSNVNTVNTVNYKIFRNEHPLPIAYTYDSYISRDDWNSFSAVEKQEALLQTIVLDNYDTRFEKNNLNFSSTDINYNVTCNGSGISLQDNTFVVTSDNATATLTFESLPNSETYFGIKGLSFDATPKYDLYWGDESVDPLNLYNKTDWKLLSYADKKSIWKAKFFETDPTSAALTLKSSAGISKVLTYYTDAYSYYNDRHDFTVNLDYNEDAVTSVAITFSKMGTYTFDSMSISCYPMDKYIDQINTLASNTLENVEFDTDTVNGTITLDTAKLLCFAIPYSEGWSAYVDGKKAELYRANVLYMALALNAGDHTVKLVYNTPFLKLGIVVSGISVVFFVILIIVLERRS